MTRLADCMTVATTLPKDGTAGALAGRVWLPDVEGPAVVAVRADGVYDISKLAPTMRPIPLGTKRADPLPLTVVKENGINVLIIEGGADADIVRLAKRHRVVDRLVFIGLAIEDEKVRGRLRKADPKVHVARLATNAEQIDAAGGYELESSIPKSADLVVARNTRKSRSHLRQKPIAPKAEFIEAFQSDSICPVLL